MKNTVAGWARIAYLVIAWLFVAGLLYQVLLVGMTLLAAQPMMEAHVEVGHIIGILMPLMLILMYVGRLPRPVKIQTWMLFGVYFLQAEIFAAIRRTMPVPAAFHPVLALVLFWLAVTVAREAWPPERTPPEAAVSH